MRSVYCSFVQMSKERLTLPVIAHTSIRNRLVIAALAGALTALVGCGRSVYPAAPADAPSPAGVALLTPAWTCGALPLLPKGAQPFAELRVLVDQRGKVAHVHVVDATNRAVGDVAAQCALRQRYGAGSDGKGRPEAGVLEVSVRFEPSGVP